YMSQGASGQPNRTIRIDANGNYDNFVTPPNSLYQEVWDMAFHCATNDIVTFGGGHSSDNCAAIINTVNAQYALYNFHPNNTAFVHDVGSGIIDDNGNTFIYYACSGNTAL